MSHSRLSSRPIPGPPRRRAAIALFALACSAASAQDATIDLQPPEPTVNDSIGVEVDYYSSCAMGLGRTTVVGHRIEFEVFEGCLCPLIPPAPVTASTTLPPLGAGRFTFEATLVPDPREADCSFDPLPLAATEFRIRSVKAQVSIDPPLANSADDLVLTLRSPCPLRIEAPSIVRPQILVTEIASEILAPCSRELTWAEQIPLGRLPPGRYVVVWNYDDGQGYQAPVTTRMFRVRRAMTQ